MLTRRTTIPPFTLITYISLPGPVDMISDDREGVYANVVRGIGGSVLSEPARHELYELSLSSSQNKLTQ